MIPNDVPEGSNWNLQDVGIVKIVNFLRFGVNCMLAYSLQSLIFIFWFHSLKCANLLIKEILPLLKMKEINGLPLFVFLLEEIDNIVCCVLALLIKGYEDVAGLLQIALMITL